MSAHKLISRWIFSPLESVPSPMVEHTRSQAETPEAAEAAAAIAEALYPPYDLPVCRQYAHGGDTPWRAPWHYNGFALVLCEMDPVHLAAAQKDPRLHVFSSIHEDEKIPDHIADHHSAHGVKRGHTLRQMLKELEKLHVEFMHCGS